MNAPISIEGSATLIRRPHFRLVGDELFFLISKRPHTRLSSSDAALWAALDPEVSVRELRKRFPGQADATIARLVDLEVCELVHSCDRSRRRRIVVFEPHSDDAALSVGGTMWMRRHECEFVVVTIASRSNCTSYYHLDREFFDVDEVSSLRHAESTLCARLLCGQHRALGQSDAPLRYQPGNWSLDWFRRHRGSVFAFVAHHSNEGELRTWTQAIRDALIDLRPDEVWIPLGSRHTDHELARNACLTALVEEPSLVDHAAIGLYEEVPHCVWFPGYATSVLAALTRLGACLRLEAMPIATVVADKLHLLSLYGSQFTVSAVRADIEASARMAGGERGPAERLWRLQRLPSAVEPLSMSADEAVVRAAPRLAAWVGRHRQAPRMRILLVYPAGRWKDDMEFLFNVFPAARFDVYTSVAAAAEIDGFASPRIGVHPVRSNWWSWTRLAVSMPMMRPMPTLVLAGERRLRESRLVATFWPMSDTVVLPTMDFLVRSLRRLVLPDPATPHDPTQSQHTQTTGMHVLA
jgi:LmbE family N-acetylglucosaminyl deacetylase